MLSSGIFKDEAGIELYINNKKIDYDRDVLIPPISTGQLFVYDSQVYVEDMETRDCFVQ